jgi:hypothetical protein
MDKISDEKDKRYRFVCIEVNGGEINFHHVAQFKMMGKAISLFSDIEEELRSEYGIYIDKNNEVSARKGYIRYFEASQQSHPSFHVVCYVKEVFDDTLGLRN